MGLAVQMLNSSHYKEIVRTADTVKKSVTDTLNFVQELRKDWPFWSDVFGRATGVTVAPSSPDLSP